MFESAHSSSVVILSVWYTKRPFLHLKTSLLGYLYPPKGHLAFQFYTTISTAFPSKWFNLTNLTSNKADAVPEELKSCALETIQERYPANEGLHIYTDSSYLPEANGAGMGWFCRLFEHSLAVGKNVTNYDGGILAVCEATTHLLSAGPAPAKVVFFIDPQAAILALSSNTPTYCLDTIQCRTKIAELIHLAGLRPYSGSQETLVTVGPIPKHLQRAEPIARFCLTTGHGFLGVHLHWHGVAANEVCPLCGHARMDGDHLPQCTGLAEYSADDIVCRYWEDQGQMVKNPSTGVG
ncbi:reverse transcriptase [Trichonephila clavipes]|nr:reverse transcriptase [Trichonephila clavipes]